MKNYYVIAIVILGLLAVFLGGLIIFRKNQASWQPELLEARSQLDTSLDTPAKEFTISVDGNTKLFGIAAHNPYYGEPPAPIEFGAEQSHEFFELWGDVISVDENEKTFRISSDYPRSIVTAFTPRGPEVSLDDLKEGDRVVVSGTYDANGEADYSAIEFIQITPSLEEIKQLRETQNK